MPQSSRSRRIFLRTFINPLFWFAALGISANALAAQPAVVDRIAAVIENEIITLRELEEKAGPFMSNLPDDPDQRRIRRLAILRKVLDIEIGEKIVSREIEASQDRLGVTTKDVDRAIEEVLKINNLSREQLQAALYGQGMTWSEYRKQLRVQIERARLIQFKVQGRVVVKDAEVKRRCRERQSVASKEIRVCASHILRKIPEGATPAQVASIHARLSKIQAELASGADFAAYALQHSDDKSAPDGDLGCFARGEMVEPFEKAAFSTNVGAVSSVLRTSFGFHILKISAQ